LRGPDSRFAFQRQATTARYSHWSTADCPCPLSIYTARAKSHYLDRLTARATGGDPGPDATDE
jgi:hypothetical protein